MHSLHSQSTMSKSTHISISIRNPVDTSIPQNHFRHIQWEDALNVFYLLISFQSCIEIEFTGRSHHRLASAESEQRLVRVFANFVTLACACLYRTKCL